MTRVAVFGASGYTGGELLRLLLAHPGVEVVQATSDQFAGKRLDFPHPHLRGMSALRFVPHDALGPCDLLVSCMPQGGLIQRWARVRELAGRVVDLSADFRLEPADHERWYRSTQGPRTCRASSTPSRSGPPRSFPRPATSRCPGAWRTPHCWVSSRWCALAW